MKFRINTLCHMKFTINTLWHIKLSINTLWHFKFLINTLCHFINQHFLSYKTPRLLQSQSITVIRLHFLRKMISQVLLLFAKWNRLSAFYIHPCVWVLFIQPRHLLWGPLLDKAGRKCSNFLTHLMISWAICYLLLKNISNIDESESLQSSGRSIIFSFLSPRGGEIHRSWWWTIHSPNSCFFELRHSKHGLKFVPFHLAALIQMVLLQTIQCEAFCFHVFQQLLNKWEKRGNG